MPCRQSQKDREIIDLLENGFLQSSTLSVLIIDFFHVPPLLHEIIHEQEQCIGKIFSAKQIASTFFFNFEALSTQSVKIVISSGSTN